MKKYICCTALILSFLFPFLSEAQEQAPISVKEKKGYKYGISIQPLYFINNGLRLDFEKAIRNDPRKLLQVSLTGYRLPRKEDGGTWNTLLFDDIDMLNKITGAGIGADYKWFGFPSANFLYISGGITYHYFNVKYDDWEFVGFEEDGLTYYEPNYREFTQHINKLGGNVCIGIQPAWTGGFLIDLYTGLGVSYGFFDKNKYHPGNTMHSMGYRGITFLLGIRFGLRFGKIVN